MIQESPRDVMAERRLIAVFLVAKRFIAQARAQGLEPDDFCIDTHKAVIRAIYGLYDAGKPVDVITVYEALAGNQFVEDAGGFALLIDLASCLREPLALLARVADLKVLARRRECGGGAS